MVQIRGCGPVIVVGSQAANPWPILARHEADLGRYSITRAEIAFDVQAASITLRGTACSRWSDN